MFSAICCTMQPVVKLALVQTVTFLFPVTNYFKIIGVFIKTFDVSSYHQMLMSLCNCKLEKIEDGFH